MTQLQTKIKLFCADSSLLHPKDYIFDKFYRNASQKKKFKKNPKFAYYNAFVKMKHNFLKNKKEIYKSPSSSQNFLKASMIQNILNKSQTFEVQKISTHLFKIYKKINTISSNSQLQDIYQLSGKTLRTHLQRITPTQETKELENIVKQYRTKKLRRISEDTQSKQKNQVRVKNLKKRSQEFFQNKSQPTPQPNFNIFQFKNKKRVNSFVLPLKLTK